MKVSKTRKPIFAAEDDFEGAPMFDDEAFGIDGEEDDADLGSDGDEDLDTAEEEEEMDIDQDDVNIEIDNNIENHYIAECERCHGIFISAVVLSDQHVDSISGICPLCGKDTDQSLKWVIKPIEEILEE